LVKNGFCARCWVQLTWYAGCDEVVAVTVNTFESGMVGMSDEQLAGVVQKNFGLSVGGTAFDSFGLKKPIFKGVCTTGHYNGEKLYRWETAKNLMHDNPNPAAFTRKDSTLGKKMGMRKIK